MADAESTSEVEPTEDTVVIEGTEPPVFEESDEVKDPNYWEPRKNWTARRVQRALRRRGYYSGEITGVFDRRTRDAIQAVLNRATSIDADLTIGSKMGPDEAVAVEQYAYKFGSYDGDLDGRLNTTIWEAFALGLERQA